MTWQVHQDGSILDTGKDGISRVVGSMVPAKHKYGPQLWRIEILWGGPGGDIIYESDNHGMALAFILGVETVFNRMGPWVAP